MPGWIITQINELEHDQEKKNPMLFLVILCCFCFVWMRPVRRLVRRGLWASSTVLVENEGGREIFFVGCVLFCAPRAPVLYWGGYTRSSVMFPWWQSPGHPTLLHSEIDFSLFFPPSWIHGAGGSDRVFDASFTPIYLLANFGPSCVILIFSPTGIYLRAYCVCSVCGVCVCVSINSRGKNAKQEPRWRPTVMMMEMARFTSTKYSKIVSTK